MERSGANFCSSIRAMRLRAAKRTFLVQPAQHPGGFGGARALEARFLLFQDCVNFFYKCQQLIRVLLSGGESAKAFPSFFCLSGHNYLQQHYQGWMAI